MNTMSILCQNFTTVNCRFQTKKRNYPDAGTLCPDKNEIPVTKKCKKDIYPRSMDSNSSVEYAMPFAPALRISITSP